MTGPSNLPSTTPYASPSEVGLSTNQDGTISLDTTAFTAALQADPTAVMNIFGNSGVSTSPLLTFESSQSGTTTSPITFSVGQANADGTLPGTFTVNGTPYSLTSSTDGTFTGADGTPLTGLVVSALAGANGTLTVSTGIDTSLDDLSNILQSANPGDIGGLINDLNEDNSNLQVQIEQQQAYLNQSQAQLEATYSNLESTVGQLQSAGQSLSTL
jgi:flagellar capping protein FliD